jgi:signal transduction histidine kinase/ActR/RegA family two-component response regulator
MADEETGAAAPDELSDGSWRRGWASAGAIIATVLLIALVAMVTLSNQQRDDALGWERRAYAVTFLTRTLDATMARSEAALGRYVVDENLKTGSLYYAEWRTAGRQMAHLQRLIRDDPEQSKRMKELRRLYDVRDQELATAARRAAAGKGSGGIVYFYQAGLSPTGPALRSALGTIAAHEREKLRERMAQTSRFAAQADKLTEWLGWLGVLIGIAAIVLGVAAYRAISEHVLARREADSEASRAMSLERAVQDRTRELRDANDRLRAEAAERATAEAQLRQVQKMEAVGQLTGGIAHDFNNMLAVIVGGLDLARRKLRGPKREVEFHLDNAMEGATRAAALTRRLLAFSRAEPLVPEAVTPSALVEGMLDLVDRSLGERITIQTRFPEEPWHIWADANQLENSILNLCVNARDAMNGEGQLTIAVENVALEWGKEAQLAPGEYVRISVTDTGSGIAPEHLERVFDPFFTTKPVGKGTGLGLSQIFGFARQSGGDVQIASALGAGTTVSLYLPRSTRTPVNAFDAPAVAAPEQPRAIQIGTSILVVEDDPRVSRATVGALEELGYHPIACASGAEALQILDQNPAVELLVTDVMMPEMTGPELVRIVGSRFPHIAVLFVTGYVREQDESEELTGYDLLRKPFTVSALSDAVAVALSRRLTGDPLREPRGGSLSGSHPAAASEAAE